MNIAGLRDRAAGGRNLHANRGFRQVGRNSSMTPSLFGTRHIFPNRTDPQMDRDDGRAVLPDEFAQKKLPSS